MEYWRFREEKQRQTKFIHPSIISVTADYLWEVTANWQQNKPGPATTSAQRFHWVMRPTAVSCWVSGSKVSKMGQVTGSKGQTDRETGLVNSSYLIRHVYHCRRHQQTRLVESVKLITWRRQQNNHRKTQPATTDWSRDINNWLTTRQNLWVFLN